MFKYLLSTGLLGAVTSGVSLLRGVREQPMTWRVGLAWLSWAITMVLAVGTARDLYRLRRGRAIADDSPLKTKETKLQKRIAKHGRL